MNKSIKITLVFLYMSFFVILTSSNFLVKWAVYELSMILTISILNVMKGSSKIVSVTYYSVSSISSIMLMFFIVIYSNMSVVSIMGSEVFFKFMLIMMFIKLSMFPFHNWMIYCYEKSSWDQVFLLSSIMKFIPISFFCHFLNLWSNLIVLLIMNSVFMSAYIGVNFSFKKLLACSTSFNNFLLVSMFLVEFKQFLFFTVMYSISIYSLTSVLKSVSCSKLMLAFNFGVVEKLFKIWMVVYSMLPLMASFMIKLNLIHEMSKFNNLLSFMFLMLLISNLIMIWKYMVIIKKATLAKKFMCYLSVGYKNTILMFSLTIFFMVMSILFNFVNN